MRISDVCKDSGIADMANWFFLRLVMPMKMVRFGFSRRLIRKRYYSNPLFLSVLFMLIASLLSISCKLHV